MTDCLAERLKKLRDLRAKLCSREKNWKEAFEARDWIVTQLKLLHNMSSSKVHTKEELKERIADILCVFEPEDENGDNHDK